MKLLCKCSASPQHTPGLYRPVIEGLMDSVLVASTPGWLNTIQRKRIPCFSNQGFVKRNKNTKIVELSNLKAFNLRSSYHIYIFFISIDATVNNQNITSLYMEALNLLNSLSPKEKVLALALETIQEKIRDLTQTNVILAMIVAACRSLASVNLMVQVVEVAVETHFSNIELPPTSEGSGTEENLVAPWSDVLASVTVPELSQQEFVQGGHGNMV